MSFRRTLLPLAAILVGLSRVHAAHYDEEFLAVPSADVDAAAKDYDFFFRVIRWSKLDASMALRVYFSRHTDTRPARGFVLLKIRDRQGEFHEGSRALTEEETQRICDLLDAGEIFSLPEKQRFQLREQPYDPGSGPGYDSFLLIDKTRHAKEAVARTPELSNTSEHMLADLKKSLGDFFAIVEQGEGAVADSKAAQKQWDAEVPTAHIAATGALDDATEVEVEGIAVSGFKKDLTPIETKIHFTTRVRKTIHEIRRLLGSAKFRGTASKPGRIWATSTTDVLCFVVTISGGDKVRFYLVGDSELLMGDLRTSRTDDREALLPLDKLLVHTQVIPSVK